MKRILLTYCLLLTICFCSFPQAIQNYRKVRPFGHPEAGDSLDIYSILHSNAPGNFPTSGVPYATLAGKDGKFLFGAGGFVKTIAGWDIGHPMESADEFITSNIPTGLMEGDNALFHFSARQTHLFVNFVALPGHADEIGAFIGANFLSDGYTPVLQYAYLKYRGLTAGYDNTLFSDPACGSPTVDYEGPCSNTCSPIAGVSYKFRKGCWFMAGGLELPQTSFTIYEGLTRKVYQRIPDIPVAFSYSWGEGNSWVRASSILRNMTYRNEIEKKNFNKTGYGFQLSGAEYILGCLTFYWQGLWGKGIGSMAQDMAGQGLDLVPTNGGKALTPVEIWGGFVSLRYDISGKLVSSVTYSRLHSNVKEFNGGSTPWGSLYKYAQYMAANIFYDPTDYLEFGAEYIWGRRNNYDGSRGADNRLQVSAQFTF